MKEQLTLLDEFLSGMISRCMVNNGIVGQFISDFQTFFSPFISRLFKRTIVMKTFLIILFFTLINCSGNKLFAQAAGDYRTNGAGTAWATATNWEMYNGAAWVAAGASPTSANGAIAVNNPMIISANLTIDQVTVSSTLTITGGTLTVNNGAGDDITVANGATLISNNATNPTINGAIRVQAGGAIELQNFTSLTYATSGNVIWETNAILNINNAAANLPLANLTFLPAATATVPIFRISQVASFTGTGDITINAILEYNYATSRTFPNNNLLVRYGIRGTGSFQTGNQTTWLGINGTTITNVILGGSGTITLGGIMRVADGATVTMTSNKTINSNTFHVGNSGSSPAATLDFSTYILSGTCGFTANQYSTLKTGHAEGFVAGTTNGSLRTSGGRTLTGSDNNVNFEYNAPSGDQVTGTGLPTTLRNLTINTATSAQIVTLSNNNTTVRQQNNGGILTLNRGIFKIGAGITLRFDNNSGGTNAIDNPNVTGTSNFATTGTNGADGGTVLLLHGSGGDFTISGSGLTTFYNFSIGTTVGSANRTVKQTNANVLINGTLTMLDNNASWQTNSPAYSVNATLYVNNNGQGYTPGTNRKEWAAWTAGTATIGTSAGYPNNVTLVNMGNSLNNGCGFGPSGNWSINGTLAIGDGTVAGLATLQSMTSFTCGGVTINNNSTLKGTSFTVNGNWLRTGTTTGIYTNVGTGTVTFTGGTAASPRTITVSPSATESSFYNLAVSNGGYAKLNVPVVIPTAGSMAVTLGGILETSAANYLSVTNTATTAISSSGSGYINGPVKWTLANSTTNTYVFPVGKGTAYLPFSIKPANAQANNVATVEAFNTNCGGIADGITVSSISTTEYWSLSTTISFTGTGSSVSVTRNAALGLFDRIAKSNSAAGLYSSIGGTVSGNSVINSAAIGTGSPWFFVLANGPITLSVVSITHPTCYGTTGSITVAASGGTAPYQYNINGGPYSGASTFSPLTAGTYVITVRDANFLTESVTITLKNVTVTDDMTICNGISVNLTASGAIAYSWASSPAGRISGSSTDAAITTTALTSTTVYTVTAAVANPFATNLITNSGFESGAPNSDYFNHTGAAYVSAPATLPAATGGIYKIGGNGNSLCSSFDNFTPHGGSNMMVIDGPRNNPPGATNRIWYQAGIAVSTNTYYVFSYWVRRASGTPNGNINTTINGTPVTGTVSNPNPFTASGTSWAQVSYAWYSGASTTADIVLYQSNGYADIGYDYAIDDLSMLITCNAIQNVTVTVSPDNVWNGSVSTDWNNAANWYCGIPTPSTNALIPAGLANYPVLNTGAIGTAKDLTIQSGAGNPYAIVYNNTLQVYGAIYNSGKFNVKYGTLEMSSTTAGQTIAPTYFVDNTIKNLKVSNTSAANPRLDITGAATDVLKITGEISFGNVNNAIIDGNDHITLVSDALGTARVADVTNAGVNSSNSIADKVTVERYIPANRAWRLLTAPINDANLSINDAWQEGKTNTGNFTQGSTPADWATGGTSVNQPATAGYGTHITSGQNSSNYSQFGYDPSPYQPSIRAYTTSWGTTTVNNVANTKPYAGLMDYRITSQQGYMLFVRGDRRTLLPMAMGAPENATVLRPKGPLNIGNKSVTLSSGGGLKVVGNPYASTINFDGIYTRNSAVLSNYYYLLDPNLTGSFNGVGAFVAFVRVGPGDYTPTVYSPSVPAAYHSNVDGRIESGAAFMVNTVNTGSNINFNIIETDKVINGSVNLFRPGKNHVRTNLFAINADGSTSLNDGVLNVFDKTFSSETNELEDVPKSFNFAESFSIARDNKWWAAEKRGLINITDTIFYTISNMKVKGYKLEVILENLDHPNLTAYMEDKYLDKKTLVSMKQPTYINFNITADAQSKAYDRFRLVFKPLIRFTHLQANLSDKNNNDALIDWTVETEQDIQKYEVERSADGVQFTKIEDRLAYGTPLEKDINYSIVDPSLKGNTYYYYRVKCVGINGAISYSNTEKVRVRSTLPAMVVYPNPVLKGIINLQMNDVKSGLYRVKLLGNNGTVTYTGLFNYNGSGNASIKINPNHSPGIYSLEITGANNYKNTLKVLIVE